MKLILSKEESESIFFDALCNGLGYVESGYGLRLDVDEKDYEDAKKDLLDKQTDNKGLVCFEDVLMQVLRRGNNLTLLDEEGGEDKWILDLNKLYENIDKIEANVQLDMLSGDGDAGTADIVIQTAFLGEVIFG